MKTNTQTDRQTEKPQSDLLGSLQEPIIWKYNVYIFTTPKSSSLVSLLVLSKVIDQESIFSRDVKMFKDIFSNLCNIVPFLQTSILLVSVLLFYNTPEVPWIIHLLVQTIEGNVLFMRKHCSKKGNVS